MGESEDREDARLGIRDRFLRFLAHAKGLRRAIPAPIRRLGRRFVSWEDFQNQKWLAKSSIADFESVSTYAGRVDVCLGIIADFAQGHVNYMAACRDLGVPYRVVDISGPDWIDRLEAHPCDAYLVWPSLALTIWKHLYDERLRIMVEQLGKAVYPSLTALWIYESKRRVHYWLRAHGVPHPRTWVFYDREEALAFASGADLPIVYKPDLGATAKGVRIFRSRTPLLRHVKRVFKRGVTFPRGDWRDRQWGSVLLQQFVADAEEWRVIRLGDSYFAYKKGRAGDFHSGSHIVLFADPPARLLDLVRQVTDMGNFTSMSLDIFESPDGEYLVNELHPVFGRDPWDHSMEVNGKPGRYVYREAERRWAFEEGIFTENASCNMRVLTLLALLGKPLVG